MKFIAERIVLAMCKIAKRYLPFRELAQKGIVLNS